MRGYLVLANAHAGRIGREALDAAVGVLSAAGPTEVCISTAPAALDAALTGLDGRVPVVAGGDGSLHLVVNRLRRLGRLDQVTVGLLPLGTGNDFARTLGLHHAAGEGEPASPFAGDCGVRHRNSLIWELVRRA